MKLHYALITLCVFNLLSHPSFARDGAAPRRAHASNTHVDIFEVTTLPLQNVSKRKMEDCTHAIHLSKAQARGRLMSQYSGLTINACAPLLQNNSCKLAFSKAGPRRAHQPRVFQKITQECADSYCRELRQSDKKRICLTPKNTRNRQWMTTFYTTILRHEFLKTNDIKGLQQANKIAQALVR